MNLAATVYLLCALSSFLCAVLLYRTYRRGGARFLLSSSVCFTGFAVANALLFVDLVLVPHTDLMVYRQVATFVSVAALAWGFVWDTR